MAGENLIGEYLRARRELVRPEDVALPDLGGRRRVPGLRREEVALLAGVSIDYYVRLEQGRDQHPSEQVLDALARALQLDDDAAAHLRRLARPPARRRRGAPRPERPPAGIVALIECWTETPAVVEGRYTDVLAANSLALALAPYYAVGTNLVRATFLDPRVRDRYEDWEQITESAVAALREAAWHGTARPSPGRPAGAQLREVPDPRRRPSDAGRLPRRAGQPERAEPRAAGQPSPARRRRPRRAGGRSRSR